MHEMQTVAINDPVARASVSLSVWATAVTYLPCGAATMWPILL